MAKEEIFREKVIELYMKAAELIALLDPPTEFQRLMLYQDGADEPTVSGEIGTHEVQMLKKRYLNEQRFLGVLDPLLQKSWRTQWKRKYSRA